jgi:hypothetical protein
VLGHRVLRGRVPLLLLEGVALLHRLSIAKSIQYVCVRRGRTCRAASC